MSTLIPAPATRPARNELAAYYGDERIRFSRTPRRTDAKSVLIKVQPDCRVIAAAPESASDSEVVRAVAKRGRWISKQLRAFQAQQEHDLPRKYISGETHLYLGRQYLLKVKVGENYDVGVKLLRGVLEVTVRNDSAKTVETAMKAWYRIKARNVFRERLEKMLPQILWINETPPFRLFEMRTQWGNCSPNGRLTLNPHLIKAPSICIDYVLLHELCHIAEHNHSDRFYRLMSQVMPQWENIKQRLDKMAGKLLA